AALVAACAKSEKPSIADTTSAPIAPVATTTSTSGGSVAGTSSLALADVAGTWKIHAVPTSGPDTTAVNYTLTATGEPSGWKANYSNGTSAAWTVTAAGDSIIADAAPHVSVLRKGVQVKSHLILRKQGDKLVGTSVAHYSKGPDSVRTLRVEGTKSP
ncbi:MAG: hypothetical protein JWN53_1309, partial [Gemmatimonadetes bacterium]|nr:hypothetical protein [Gemmatimonadota bacterium]